MATVIVTILIGLLIAFFAIQNTGNISLHFLQYTTPHVAVYIVIIGALLVGLFFSWILSTVTMLFTGMTLREKENKITDYRKENAELVRKINHLELENTKLKTETKSPVDEKSL